MILQSFVAFNDTLPKTCHPYQICASEIADIDTHKADFEIAINIVDAQFYYTNPLLFVFVKSEECEEFAQLYGDYFLIPPRYYDALDLDTRCIAANFVFIDHICMLSELSKDEPRLKHSHKELQEQADTQPNMLNSLFQLYQEKGMYIIGVKHNEEL